MGKIGKKSEGGKKKFYSRKTFYRWTAYVGIFNVILMGVLVGLQKSNFLHRQSLYPGTSNPGNTVLQEVPSIPQK
jgi:hypothetical protein